MDENGYHFLSHLNVMTIRELRIVFRKMNHYDIREKETGYNLLLILRYDLQAAIN